VLGQIGYLISGGNMFSIETPVQTQSEDGISEDWSATYENLTSWK
jgi:hypothetical protein